MAIPLGKKWVGNAGANIIGGLSTALLSFVLPAILARWMTKMEFSLWSLAFQVVAYVSVFGYGINSAVSKYVSEKKDAASVAKILRGSLKVLSISSTLGLIFLIVVVWASRYIFSEIPINRQDDFKLTVLVLGIAALFQNFGLIPIGYFTGRYRNIDFVLPQLLGRGIILATVFFSLLAGTGLVRLSLAYCFASLVPVYLLWRKMLAVPLGTQPFLHVLQFDSEVRLLNSYCAGLLVWSLSMLLVNAVDTILVGYVNIQEVGAYSVALTYVTILGGVINALISPIVPIASSIYADQQQKAHLPNLLHKITFFNTLAMNVLLLLTIILGKYLLTLWVGAEYVEATYTYLLVLTAANCVRYLGMPYSTMLMGTALHRVTFLSAILEGGGNLVFSLWFANLYGVIGVAYGTLAGALMGLLSHFFINFRKTDALTPNWLLAVIRGYLLPSLICIPFYGLIYVINW